MLADDAGVASAYSVLTERCRQIAARARRHIEAGRMGKIKIDDKGEAAMADPFIYDAKNIDEFSKIF